MTLQKSWLEREPLQAFTETMVAHSQRAGCPSFCFTVSCLPFPLSSNFPNTICAKALVSVNAFKSISDPHESIQAGKKKECE